MVMTKQERARQLRYKKGALAAIGWASMMDELSEIESACSDVHWYFASNDGSDTLLAAMDGDEEDEYEFKMAFADLEGKCELLWQRIHEDDETSDYYDDCLLALIGNRYQVIGFDSVEEDYFSLCRYEADLATTEAGKRVCRLTKAEMLAKIGQCMGIALAFLDLRQSYDYLKATLDILRNDNMSILQIIKDIEKIYMAAVDDWRIQEEFDRLRAALPDKVWLE